MKDLKLLRYLESLLAECTYAHQQALDAEQLHASGRCRNCELVWQARERAVKARATLRSYASDNYESADWRVRELLLECMTFPA